MINTKLIVFEGIPGSGKTTTSQLLYKYFLENGVNSTAFIEGCQHPIDLSFYGYLSLTEYNTLILKYQDQAEWLKQNSIVEDNYVLSPYKILEPYPYNALLIEYLNSKEFCYSRNPIVSFDTFKHVFYRRFERYVIEMVGKDEITIFESTLLQHQIHDTNRLYPHIRDDEIIAHLNVIADIIKPLNPVIFYISQNNVKESLERTAFIRSKPKWSTKETIAYYEKRKALELCVIKQLPLKSIVLDNTDYDWDKMFNTILNSLSLSS
ncbi:MAG: hypothetical protein APF77_06795 [Clostridia bacterium BRH_c25]|nr:MAG: hypothetical protein APF77_06795 [Clostridia bacterium BRH_c25]